MNLPEQSSTALRLVHRVDHNLCLLRALSRQPGWAEWYRRRPGGDLSPAPSTDSFYSVEELFANVSELPDGRHKRHALGSLTASAAHLRLLARQPHLRSLHDAHQDLLPNLLGGGLYDTLGTLSPTQAYVFGAFAATLGPCDVNILSEFLSFDDFQVTTAGLTFTSNRPLADMPRKFDPRLWDQRAPETFRAANRIAEPPADPGADPTRLETDSQERERQGQPWNGLLFEDAVASSGGAELLEFRNVLIIDFAPQITGDAATDNVFFEYALYEGLTVELLAGETFAGGLDRDSGFGEVTNTANGTLCRVTKSVRIARPDDARRDLLNWDIAVALQFWLSQMTILGVCEA